MPSSDALFPPPRPRRRPPARPRALATLTALTTMAGASLLLGGCGQLGVQPWERDLMAKPSMQLSSSPLEAAADDHTYFSKEAATGGRGFGGGGCGCN